MVDVKPVGASYVTTVAPDIVFQVLNGLTALSHLYVLVTSPVPAVVLVKAAGSPS